MTSQYAPALNTGTFMDQLLRVLGEASNVAGSGTMQTDVDGGTWQRNVKQRMLDLQRDRPALQVANARFALGADDGAYLRSNVMPLQTAEPDCDSHSLSARAPPDIEAASRQGVLEALLADHTTRTNDVKSDVGKIVDTLAWLLSINEIAEFVCANFAERVRNRTNLPADDDAMNVAGYFKGGVNAEQGKKALEADFVGEKTGEAVCMLLRVVLALFGPPRAAMERQLAETLGDEDKKGSMANLNGALDRLAISARFVTATNKADAVEAYTDPGVAADAFREAAVRQATAAAAVGFNAAVTGRIDFGAVHFPPGYDISIEFDHPSDACATNERMTERVVQRMLWAVSTDTSADTLRGAVVNPAWREGSAQPKLIFAPLQTNDALNARVRKRKEELTAAQNEVAITKSDLEAAENTQSNNNSVTDEATLRRSEAERAKVDEDVERLTAKLAWQTALEVVNTNYIKLLESDIALAAAIDTFVETSITSKMLPQPGTGLQNAADKLVLDEFKEDPDTIAMLKQHSIDSIEEADLELNRQAYLTIVKHRWRFNLGRIFAYKDDTDPGVDTVQAKNKNLEYLTESVKPPPTSGLLAGFAKYLAGSTTQTADVTSTKNPMMARFAFLKDRFKQQQFDWDALETAAVERNDWLLKALAAAIENLRLSTEYVLRSAEIESQSQQRDQEAGGAPVEAQGAAQAEVGQTSFTFCAPYYAEDADAKRKIDDALSAGLTQMREDSGFVAAAAAGGSSEPPPRVERRAGISPFFTAPRQRPLVRTSNDGTTAPDWWSRTLWPSSPPAQDVPLSELPSSIDVVYGTYGSRPTTPSVLMANNNVHVAYALARGLCGKRPPHHQRPDPTDKDSTLLQYNAAMVDYVAPPPAATTSTDAELEAKRERATRTQVVRDQKAIFGSRELPVVADFVEEPLTSDVERADDSVMALWAPIEKSGDTPTIVPSGNGDAKVVAESVVLEHLVDHFKRLAAQLESGGGAVHMLALGAAAYTKVHQLASLCAALHKSHSTLCNPHPEIGGAYYTFFTRPVMRCPGSNKPVLYPCDAGLASYVLTPPGSATPRPPSDPDATLLDVDVVYGALGGSGKRNKVSRSEATSYMRGLLAQPPQSDASTSQQQVSAERAHAVPLYIAPVPGSTQDEIYAITTTVSNWPSNTPTLRNDGARERVPDPSVRGHLEAIQPDALESALRGALKRCTDLERYRAEVSAITERLKEERAGGAGVPSTTDDAARVRREAVWNDATREACISGDRLYAFARQFAGTISEQVDSICLIDEGMLVRQQQDSRAARQRLVDRAAQEHMNMVRSVFAAVLKESGLTLGIETQGSIGELKVVSNSLRKQASELAAGGSSSEGYFANSVRLENLLSTGTGEMTLNDLFQRLGDAGKALQQAALSSQSDSTPGSSVSLDFLSAPRNSLLLRWKPEALAAVRQAFDLFQREVINLHGPSYRTISAFELMEGCDDALCSAFAQFCAHCLVHSRLYSSSTAMYVAAWPAAANATQLKVSLRRLVNLACEYLRATPTPAFLSESGRANYFSCAGSRGGGYGLPMVIGRHIPQPGGMWSRDFYK